MKRFIWTKHVSRWDEALQKDVFCPEESSGYWYEGAISLAMDSAIFDQLSFRFYDDDGTNETNHTVKAAIDTDITNQALDENLLIRILLDETAGIAEANLKPALQVSLNSGAFQDVTDISTIARSFGSTGLTDGGDTTQIIGVGASYLLVNQGQEDVSGVAGGTACDWAGNEECEFVYCVQILSADVSASDTVDFRISDGQVDSYTIPYARATIAAGGGQIIAVNTAIETDTALVVVADAPQTIEIGFATETDTGLVVVPDDGAAGQDIAVNTAIETDTAQLLTPRLILNLAEETDTARTVGPAVTLVVGQAVETDTGLKLDPLLIIGLASETDTAFVVNPDTISPQFITPGIAIEVDTGRAVSALQILNYAAEADTANVVAPVLSIPVGLATDTETAQVMTPVLTLGLAIETDTGFLTTPILTLGRAAEADSVLAITPKLIIQLAVETDTALAVTLRPAPLSIGIETDTALAITPDLTIITFGGKYNILESFPTGQSDVVVTLYDPITGFTVALDDTECKELGSTGMYIWGNDKLTAQPTGYQEYVYQMTDGVTTVDGVFRMPQYDLVQHFKGLTAYG